MAEDVGANVRVLAKVESVFHVRVRRVKWKLH